jgi:DNA-binding transcriptional ArsR family regulator
MFLFPEKYHSVMRTVQPSIAGLVRSAAQGKVLAELLLHPDREFTLSDLATLTGEPVPTVHREVNRLTETGIATDRRVGRSRLVSAGTENPIVGPLTQIILLTFGPLPALHEALAEVPGVQEAYVYGSWAARMSGEAGPFPGDVDVLVIGDASRMDVYDAVGPVERLVGHPVNATVLTPDAWTGGDAGFVATVRSRPLIPIPLEASRDA